MVPTQQHISLVQIEVSYACGGIEVDWNGFCVKACPIFSWMIGKHVVGIKLWVREKNGKFTVLPNAY